MTYDNRNFFSGECVALSFRDHHVFMRQLVEISNVFNTLTLKQIFWKTKTFFKKLEYCFLKTLRLKTYHFHTKLPYQKPMLRQIKWVSTKWTHHKEWSFTGNYFIFLKILFQFKNLL